MNIIPIVMLIVFVLAFISIIGAACVLHNRVWWCCIGCGKYHSDQGDVDTKMPFTWNPHSPDGWGYCDHCSQVWNQHRELVGCDH